jgi:hypothetical protein
MNRTSIVIIILVMLSFLVGGILGHLHRNDDLVRIERIINVSLANRSGVEAEYGELSDGAGAGLYWGYVRFNGDLHDFEHLCDDLHAKPREYVPAAWGWALDSDRPRWWTARLDTPNAACGRGQGVSGWLIAKYEAGHVFLTVTAMGGEP